MASRQESEMEESEIRPGLESYMDEATVGESAQALKRGFLSHFR